MRFSAGIVRAVRENWPRLQAAIEATAATMLPRARGADWCEETTQEALCLGWIQALRLADRGKAPWRWPVAFARFQLLRAVRKQSRCGRGRTAPELAAQADERLPVRHGAVGAELAVVALGADPADLTAGRLDLSGWLDTLPAHWRTVAEVLATGCTTQAAAAQLGVTSGWVSQFRRRLLESWRAFHGSEVFA